MKEGGDSEEKDDNEIDFDFVEAIAEYIHQGNDAISYLASCMNAIDVFQ